jgi:hypothetical protein
MGLVTVKGSAIYTLIKTIKHVKNNLFSSSKYNQNTFKTGNNTTQSKGSKTIFDKRFIVKTYIYPQNNWY